MNKISKTRRTQIKEIVLNLLRAFQDVYLPMPIKKIAKSLPNCRVVPYSQVLKRHNLNNDSIQSLFNSQDACSDYNAIKKTYIIYYNDTNKSIINSNRYRWNIAHELGHILLDHHKNQHTRLFRNSLTKREYDVFEQEADMFAAYILVPHIILYFQEIHSSSDIANLCRISKSAAKYRFQEFILWYKNSKLTDDYDRNIQIIFHNSNVTQERIFCGICKTHVGFKNKFHYCYICGNNKTRYIVNGGNMIYYGIEVDKNAKALKCPICGNEELHEGDYCKTCGAYLLNKCENSENYTSCVESIAHPLPGNARFCPYCGNGTSFFRLGYLKSWNYNQNIEKDDTLPF